MIRSWCAHFRPDAILLDGLYGGAVAQWLSRLAGVPLLFRSHNVEHQYMREQASRERRIIRRLGLLANLIGLARFERRMMHNAVRVLDISQEDCEYWQKQGISNVSWLPTCVDPEYLRSLKLPQEGPDIDVLYFGNLNTPNNVDAVRWLVESVLPLVQGPSLQVVLAGSRPSAAVLSLAQRDPRIQLLENPENMATVVARARTIVNPMRSGSGVNLKSVEMLFSDAALVSTRVGVKGMSEEAKACFNIADDAEAFARGIQDGVEVGKRYDERRDAVRGQFSMAAVTNALAAADLGATP
jgi:hypothetical protein